MIDFQDSNELMTLANKNIELSKEYAEIKRDQGTAQVYFGLKLANLYKEGGETKTAYDKIILTLIISEEDNKKYRELIMSEYHAKALEKIMNANSEKLMLSMSLIKNKQKILGES